MGQEFYASRVVHARELNNCPTLGNECGRTLPLHLPLPKTFLFSKYYSVYGVRKKSPRKKRPRLEKGPQK